MRKKLHFLSLTYPPFSPALFLRLSYLQVKMPQTGKKGHCTQTFNSLLRLCEQQIKRKRNYFTIISGILQLVYFPTKHFPVFVADPIALK